MTTGNPLPEINKKRLWLSTGVTVPVAGLLTLIVIYKAGEYGMALFVLIPLFLGVSSAVIYGRKQPISRRQAVGAGLISLGVYAAALLVFAIEGIICVTMAAPIVVPITCIGSIIGHGILNAKNDRAAWVILLLIGSIPATAFMENSPPPLHTVVTSVEINASREEVWKQVVEFSELKEPDEFIFRIGIAYPIHAKIDRKGVGAVRHCNFTTGSFVEPITVWDEPGLLKFDVLEQPAPLRELSFWNINAPHLHDYFISKEGQFKLTALPNGHTLLEGTTWYYHDIRPAFYWRLWSDYIIHKIHGRVLEHIKTNAEHAE
ncbi:hypothetical protein [Chitinophaga barathri]|uniref:SRPBCC family protein n=1 Tax=Chitinophaga barathri TaxID=1647451 RepID=A0A3N4MD63_9BACT|nr:hypothetical protein [Chitinophaga barathri]RPD41661.1 hypothetical protein EG028_10175 [Chitinophaga barathri]